MINLGSRPHKWHNSLVFICILDIRVSSFWSNICKQWINLLKIIANLLKMNRWHFLSNHMPSRDNWQKRSHRNIETQLTFSQNSKKVMINSLWRNGQKDSITISKLQLIPQPLLKNKTRRMLKFKLKLNKNRHKMQQIL